MSVFFASDLHFSHTNILSFSPERVDALDLNVDKEKLARAYRDYRNDRKDIASKSFILNTIGEMNEAIITKWNEKVGFSDDVYILGDVSFAKKEVTEQFLKRMNGRLHLVRGNHENNTDSIDRWEWVKDYHEGSFDRQKIVMCHYQFMEFNGQHKGYWALHGHQHGMGMKHPGKCLDVAMESIGMVAIELEEVRAYMETRPIVAHGTACE